MALQAAGKEESMFATQGPTQDPSSFVLIALVITISATIFWRTMIKIIASSFILLAILGLSELLRNLH